MGLFSSIGNFFKDSGDAVTGGLLGIGGSLISGSQASSAASESWRHQREMAQNKHQWEVEDLKKAGLNPILSAKFGGATAPQAPKADVPDYGKSASAGALAGVQLAKTRQDIALSRDQQELLAAQTSSAQSAAEISRIEAKERRLQHEQVYDSPKASRVASETRDFPKAIRGPYRTVVSVGHSALDRVKRFFKNLKSRASSAKEREFLDREEKKVLKNLSQGEKERRMHGRFKKKYQKQKSRSSAVNQVLSPF